MINTYMGLALHESPFAQTTIERPNKVPRSKSKRIRNKWKKKYGVYEVIVPGMFMTEGNLFLHPSLTKKLDKALDNFNKDRVGKRDNLLFQGINPTFKTCLSTPENTLTYNTLMNAMGEVNRVSYARRRQEGLRWSMSVYDQWKQLREINTTFFEKEWEEAEGFECLKKSK
jgi:hypothetical protein